MTLLSRLSKSLSPADGEQIKAAVRRAYEKGHKDGRAEAEAEAEAVVEEDSPRWAELAESYAQYPEHIRESAREAANRGEL